MNHAELTHFFSTTRLLPNYLWEGVLRPHPPSRQELSADAFQRSGHGVDRHRQSIRDTPNLSSAVRSWRAITLKLAHKWRSTAFRATLTYTQTHRWSCPKRPNCWLSLGSHTTAWPSQSCCGNSAKSRDVPCIDALAVTSKARSSVQGAARQRAEDEAAFITSLVEHGIDAASREEVEALILEELRGLHEGVLVRYGVRPSEFALWARRRRAIW